MSYTHDRQQRDDLRDASPARPGTGRQLDEKLEAAARRVAIIRGWFYAVVLLVALGGQITGAVETLGLAWFFAVPAVTALELGGVVVMANADVRRRLGERATASRLLSAGIAGGAVSFNWLTHADRMTGAFFAGMSLLGYLVWLMHTENSRRDRLRATGDLPPVTPAYEPVGHWLRHPWVTRRALALAKASPGLGLYPSLQAARAQIRAERRHSALSTVLHRKIRKALDADTADIAVAVYDLDEIAHRLAERADYDGLTALIAADLSPARVLAGNQPAVTGRRWWGRRRAAGPDPAAVASAQRLIAEVLTGPTAGRTPDNEPAAIEAASEQPPAPPVESDWDRVQRELDELMPAAPRRRAEAEGIGRNRELPDLVRAAVDRTSTALAVTAPAEVPEQPGEATAGSLRSRVYGALDQLVPAGDERDNITLIGLVVEHLALDPGVRGTAGKYVRSWRADVAAGRREPAAGRRLRAVPGS